MYKISCLEENGVVFRIKPATLSVHGLRVCGVLWDVNCKVNVPKTQREFASRWQEEVTYQNGEGIFDGLERQIPLVQDFFGFCFTDCPRYRLPEVHNRSRTRPGQHNSLGPVWNPRWQIEQLTDLSKLEWEKVVM